MKSNEIVLSKSLSIDELNFLYNYIGGLDWCSQCINMYLCPNSPVFNIHKGASNCTKFNSDGGPEFKAPLDFVQLFYHRFYHNLEILICGNDTLIKDNNYNISEYIPNTNNYEIVDIYLNKTYIYSIFIYPNTFGDVFDSWNTLQRLIITKLDDILII